ncbi:MAG: hypothetical protein AAFP99_05430 [Pseudomonadota bacterium]
MGGKLFWILGGLLIGYIGLSNVGWFGTVGAFDGSGYYLISENSADVDRRLYVWVGGPEKPVEPHAVMIAAESTFLGLSLKLQLPDGVLVTCSLRGQTATCPPPWTLISHTRYEAMRSQ